MNHRIIFIFIFWYTFQCNCFLIWGDCFPHVVWVYLGKISTYFLLKMSEYIFFLNIFQTKLVFLLNCSFSYFQKKVLNYMRLFFTYLTHPQRNLKGTWLPIHLYEYKRAHGLNWVPQWFWRYGYFLLIIKHFQKLFFLKGEAWSLHQR